MNRTSLGFAIGALVIVASAPAPTTATMRSAASSRALEHTRRLDKPGGWMKPLDRRRQYVFVSSDKEIDVYTLEGRLHGQITDVDEPYGLAVDHVGNLYVVDDEGSDISVFHRGAVKPFEKLGNPSYEGFQNITVALDGTVYATVGIYSGYGGEIFAYPKGSLSPTRELFSGSFNYLEYITTDRSGNLYDTYNKFDSSGFGPAGVQEWIQGKGDPSNVNLDDLVEPLGIDVTADGALVICDGGVSSDSTTYSSIKTFAAGSQKPTSSFIAPCDDISLARKQTRVLATDETSFTRFAYPSGAGAFTVNGQVYSIAVLGAVTD